MEEMHALNQYRKWCDCVAENDLLQELNRMNGDIEKITDAFYRDLEFGTGGLRGILGAGTNRMNVYTVAKASQGLANYLRKTCGAENSVAIGFDSRIHSTLFAQVSAGVLAANGIQVKIYPALMPTPCLSYAVRRLNCTAGIMITASHNPAKYNGFKVYRSDGCQITTGMAKSILAEIDQLDIFQDIARMEFQEGLNSGLISYIGSDVYTGFIEEVKRQSVLGAESIDKNIAIVYTPLHGAGLQPVLRTLKEFGYTNVQVVKEQEQPDGMFTTCPYPNPEIKESMALGMELAKSCNADLLLATDPDCDRVGIAVRTEDNGYRLLSGNETGLLLFDYICSRRAENGTMPRDPVMVKTIVTTDLVEKIAQHYGVNVINVLTGFKYIGETISSLEHSGKLSSYIFGFEESCGYLSGTYVRDKDAVNASLLICEMFCYYKKRDITLFDRLKELYRIYGFCKNSLYSYQFEGAQGAQEMQHIMYKLRDNIEHIGPARVEKTLDYLRGIHGLPASDVLKFDLDRRDTIVIRPSGTEPKIKVYISVNTPSEEEALQRERALVGALEQIFEQASCAP